MITGLSHQVLSVTLQGEDWLRRGGIAQGNTQHNSAGVALNLGGGGLFAEEFKFEGSLQQLLVELRLRLGPGILMGLKRYPKGPTLRASAAG